MKRYGPFRGSREKNGFRRGTSFPRATGRALIHYKQNWRSPPVALRAECALPHLAVLEAGRKGKIIFYEMTFEENVSLAKYSHYQIGGPSRYFFLAETEAEALAALREARARGLKIFILGGGTNILFADEGFDGLVLKADFKNIDVDGNEIVVGAGVAVADLVRTAEERALSGWEWAGGLPGTVGGALRGNAGAFGGETKNSVVTVTSINTETLARHERSREECRFGYRSSIFKEIGGTELIVSARFALTPGDAAAIRAVAEKNIAYRRERHPIELPNIGSIFKNIPVERVSEAVRSAAAHAIKKDPFPVVPAAYLIAETKLGGRTHGGAMISPKHPNFIVNTGGASAADVRALMGVVRAAVREKFSVELEPEVFEVGP